MVQRLLTKSSIVLVLLHEVDIAKHSEIHWYTHTESSRISLSIVLMHRFEMCNEVMLPSTWIRAHEAREWLCWRVGGQVLLNVVRCLEALMAPLPGTCVWLLLRVHTWVALPAVPLVKLESLKRLATLLAWMIHQVYANITQFSSPVLKSQGGNIS